MQKSWLANTCIFAKPPMWMYLVKTHIIYTNDIQTGGESVNLLIANQFMVFSAFSGITVFAVFITTEKSDTKTNNGNYRWKHDWDIASGKVYL